jgi:hypothetical protein
MEKQPIKTAEELLKAFNKLGPAGAVRLMVAALRDPIYKIQMSSYSDIFIRQEQGNPTVVCLGCAATNMLMRLTQAPYPKEASVIKHHEYDRAAIIRHKAYLNDFDSSLTHMDFLNIRALEESINQLRAGSVGEANYYLNDAPISWSFPKIPSSGELPFLSDDYTEEELAYYEKYAQDIEDQQANYAELESNGGHQIP